MSIYKIQLILGQIVNIIKEKCGPGDGDARVGVVELRGAESDRLVLVSISRRHLQLSLLLNQTQVRLLLLLV